MEFGGKMFIYVVLYWVYRNSEIRSDLKLGGFLVSKSPHKLDVLMPLLLLVEDQHFVSLHFVFFIYYYYYL